MNDNQQLRERMWELCYELLAPEESEALIARIKSDPAVARLYAEVRLQADLVGRAAQVEDASLVLAIPSKDGKEIPKAAELAPAGRKREGSFSAKAPQSTSSAWGLKWLAACAAAVLVGLIGYGQFRPLASQRRLESELVIAEVRAPAQLRAGLPSTLDLRTKSLEDQVLPAAVEVSLVDASGTTRYRKVVETNADGQAQVEVPGDKLLPPSIRLEVQAHAKQLGARHDAEMREQSPATEANFFAQELPVQPEPAVTYTMLEKPSAAPGESVRFAAVRLNAYSRTPAAPPIDDYVVERGDGTPVVKPVTEVAGDIVKGEFQVPPIEPLDRLAMSSRDKDGTIRQEDRMGLDAPESQTFNRSRRSSGGPEGLRLETAHTEAVEKEESKPSQPEPPQSKPIDPKLAEASPLPAPAASGTRPSESAEKPANRPLAAPGSRKVGQEGGQENGASALAKGMGRPQPQLAGGGEASAAIVPPGGPLEVQVPEPFGARQLEASVTARSGEVLREKLATDEGEARGLARKFAIALPDEIEGPVRVDWLDRSQSPPQVVAQEFFYRLSSRQLAVNFVDPTRGALEYPAGANVKLHLQVVDEAGQPAPCTLGVRVWSERSLQELGEEPVLLADVLQQSEATYFESEALQAGQDQSWHAKGRDRKLNLRDERKLVLKSAQSPSADGYVQADPNSMSGSLDFYDLPPTNAAGEEDLASAAAVNGVVFTNADSVRNHYGQMAAQYESQQRAWRGTLGRVLVLGGLAALVLLGLLVLFRSPVKSASNLMVLAAAAASLVFGIVWMDPSEHAKKQIAAVPTDAAEADAEATRYSGLGKEASRLDSTADAPAPAGEPGAAPTTYGLHPSGVQDGAPDAADLAGMEALSPLADATPLPSGGRTTIEGLNEPAAAGAAGSPAPPPAGTSPDSFHAPAPSPGLAPAAPIPPAEPGSGAGGFGGYDKRALAESGLERGKSKQQSGLKTGAVSELEQLAELDLSKKQAAGSDQAAEEKAQRLAAIAPKSSPPQPAKPDAGSEPAATPALPLPAPPRAAAPATAESASIATAPAGDGSRPAIGSTRRYSQTEAISDKPMTVRGGASARPAVPARSPADSNSANLRLADAEDQQHTLDRKATFYERGSNEPPAALYFNPQLATDDQGRATIEFTLPPVASQYRVLIDAFGQGRVGSAQAVVTGKEAAAK